MKRVDLADLLTKARACGTADGALRCVSAPHRDGLFDVLTEPDGAEIYERCLLVDAEFAVSAQPAVVEALALRIQELEAFIRVTFLGNSPRANDVLSRGVLVAGHSNIKRPELGVDHKLVRAIVRDAMRKAATLAARGELGNHPDFDVIADEATRNICGDEAS